MFDGKRVRWLIPYIDYDYPSQRLRVLNVHTWLQARGVDSELAHDLQGLDGAHVVVLSQASRAAPIAHWCRERGIATCLDICEDVAVLQNIGAVPDVQAVDIICCCSTVLCTQHCQYGPVIRIPDAYEPLPAPPVRAPRERLLAVWCGMQGNTICLNLLYDILAAAEVDLLTISEAPTAAHGGRHKIWQRETWLADMAIADVALCPQRHWLQPGKSNNKVTQAMALELPVLASPTVAYQEAITHGVSGFICHSLEDWYNYLILLRGDPALRQSLGQAARDSARAHYSIDAIGACWLGLLSQLLYRSTG